MSNKIDPRIHIGEEYGIYTIVDVTDERRKDGHLIFKGVCKECGYERYSALSTFKNNNVQICDHRNLLSDKQLNVWYKHNKKQCLFCGKDIPLGNLGFTEYKERKFCNSSCAASYNKNRTIKEENKSHKYCLNCGKEIPLINTYCSIKCHNEYDYTSFIKAWKSGEESGTITTGASNRIKKYLWDKYGNQCCKCGWHEINPFSGKIPLEVHHKDGNYKNNQEDNLELLCPNCHSLTESYRALNVGNGREDRYKNK